MNLLAIPTILDPTLKNIYFSDPVACARAINIISLLLKQNQAKSPRRNDLSNSDTSEVKSALFKEHNKKIQKAWQNLNDISTANSSTLLNELSIYIQRATPEKIQENSLRFWKQIRTRYPSVSEITLRNVSSIATPVPSERLFSKAGLVQNQ